MRAFLILTAFVAGLAVVSFASPASAGTFIGDGEIAQVYPDGGAFVGGGVVNETGENQTVKAKIPKKGSTLVYWRVGHNGPQGGPATWKAHVPGCLDALFLRPVAQN